MEELLVDALGVLVPVVEACGATVIVVGALWAFVRFVVVGLRDRDAGAFVPVRLTLGRFLALGLEFQLASDVLRTAVAPSFRELGQLAAVAAIRTALNYFLAREQAPASAAAILVLRRLIGFGLRTGGRTWASTRPDRPSRLPDLRRLVRPAWRA